MKSKEEAGWWSYLTGRDDLERSQSGLEIGDVGLEFVESSCNCRFGLGGVLS